LYCEWVVGGEKEEEGKEEEEREVLIYLEGSLHSQQQQVNLMQMLEKRKSTSEREFVDILRI
jgi:hypothetical protein